MICYVEEAESELGTVLCDWYSVYPCFPIEVSTGSANIDGFKHRIEYWTASMSELKYPRGARVKLDNTIDIRILDTSRAIISKGLNKPYNTRRTGDLVTVPIP